MQQFDEHKVVFIATITGVTIELEYFTERKSEDSDKVNVKLQKGKTQ